MLIGICGRNAETFEEADYQIIEQAKLESIKMMAHTKPETFHEIKQRFPDIYIITRLYNTQLQEQYFNNGKAPTPDEFVNRLIPTMNEIHSACGCESWEIHNEPNHKDRYEGWGQEFYNAVSFNEWFIEVLQRLRTHFPEHQFGFPGLAVPHNDLEWLMWCKPAMDRADWLGNHTYWQTPVQEYYTYLGDFWGKRFKYYHQKFPNKDIEITECGNSNIQSGITTTEQEIANQYVEWIEQVSLYNDYIHSCNFYIMSSPDEQNWGFFSWRDEQGRLKPVVKAIGAIEKPVGHYYWLADSAIG